MPDSSLAGVGVLVTRPRHQAADLAAAIEQRGGMAICFPSIDIVPRDPAAVGADADRLPRPDIAIFVSSNAVAHGLDFALHARIAAIGPATAAAIEAAGRRVDIRSATGFDSEHLLAKADLADMSGKTVRIIRGQDGRELLADTLRRRGARVDYLAVYESRMPQYTAADIDALVERWQAGDIDVVTVMSVASLANLVALLPPAGTALLARTLLVTPAERVLKEAQRLFPDIPAALCRTPAATDIVDTIAAPGIAAPG